MENFSAAVQSLAESQSDQTFDKSFSFFCSINTMDLATAISAYQALNMYCLARDLSVFDGTMGKIRTAIIGRLVLLANQSQEDKRKLMVESISYSTNLPLFVFGP